MTLAELRYHIRRFLRVRAEAARGAGIEPQQYQLLLQVKGMDGARRRPSAPSPSGSSFATTALSS